LPFKKINQTQDFRLTIRELDCTEVDNMDGIATKIAEARLKSMRSRLLAMIERIATVSSVGCPGTAAKSCAR